MTTVVTQLIVDASGAKQGVADFEASMAKAKAAAIDNGTATATAFETAQRRWTASLGATDPVVKAQIAMGQAMARQQAINTQAVQLGITTQDAAAVQLDKVRQKYQEHVDAASGATVAQKAFAAATSGVSAQLVALSAGAGPVGVFLSALGPWGIAAAVVLGTLEHELNAVSAGAHDLAQQATELKDFADTTGLTTTQVQALSSEAAKFSLTGEQAENTIRQFTSRFNELRLGQGDLLTQIRRVNPALADQMAGARDTASALTLFGKALQGVDDVFQRNALVRAAGGRGGLAAGQFLTGLDVNAVTGNSLAGGQTLDSAAVDALAKLDSEIKRATASASKDLNSIFAQPVLQWELDWKQAFAKFAHDAAAATKDSGLYEQIMVYVGAQLISAVGSVVPALGKKMAEAASAALPQVAHGGPALAGSVPDLTVGGVGAAVGMDQTQTPQYLLSKQKELLAVLGPSATLTDQYNLKLAELAIRMKDAGVAENDVIAIRAKAGLSLENVIALESVHNSAMGAGAPIADLVKQKIDDLQKKQESLKGSDQELTDSQLANAKRLIQAQTDGTFALRAQIDATNVQTATIGMAVGAADAYQIVQTKINDNLNAGKPALDGVTAGFVKLAAAAGAAKQAQAELKAQNDATFGLQTVFLSSTEQQIASLQRSLHGNDWQAFMNDGLSATVRLTATLKETKDLGVSFTTDFVHGLMQGKSVVDSLVASLQSMSQKLADKAITDLFSGNFVQAAVEGVEAIVTFAASKFLDAGKKAQEEAVALAKATAAAQSFDLQLQGGGSGNIQNQFNTLQDQGIQAIVALNGKNQALVNQIMTDFSAFVQRTDDQFIAGWQGMVDQLKAGLGDSAPFAQARANVAQLFSTVKDFVDNTTYLATARPGYTPTLTAADVAKAQEAGQQFLLSLIPGAPVLSATATELARITGTASALQDSLVALGMSASDAATAIASQLSVALDKLKSDTIQGLTARLNTATGQGFLNDIQAAITQHQTDLADAASLGISTSLVDQVFAAEVQKIIDDTGIVGDAFTALTNQFPDLVGVVHQATAAIQDQAAAQEDLNRAASSVVDYLNNLVSGPNSALSPQQVLANAQSAYNANLTLAQGGNIDAVNKFPQLADNLEKAAKAVYASAQGYQDIRNQIINQGLALPAVQQTTDPVVIAMRDAITAIQATTAAVTGTTTAVAATTTAVAATTTAVNAVNANAGIIVTNTNNTATNTGAIGAISVNTANTVAGLASAGAIASAVAGTNTSIGTVIANTGNAATSLTTGGLVANNTAAIATNTGSIVTNTGNTASNTGSIGNISISTGSIATNTGNTAGLLTSTNTSGIGNIIINTGNAATSIGESNALLSSIQALNNTQVATLSLLQGQFAPGALAVVTGSDFRGTTLTTETVNNNMLTALNKIVWNTYATSLNTAHYVDPFANNAVSGIFAGGGMAPPFTSFLAMEHSPFGPLMGRTGSEPMFFSPGAPQGLANDNSMAAEIRALRSEVAALRKELRYNSDIASAHMDVSRKGHAAAVEAVEGIDDTIKSEARQDRNNPRFKVVR